MFAVVSVSFFFLNIASKNFIAGLLIFIFLTQIISGFSCRINLFHLIQSFKPGEVNAETAHRLGQQFANEVLKGKYEYVIRTC
ncbi:relaxase/mobilization nuclease domain-containing protein [Blautia intestinalis]|uniref:relaxase/mobilization nuclease domain-containing protein n=1 Tax=Blautia intestinalis TaxID=2763028 RepID=UPI003A7F5C5A